MGRCRTRRHGLTLIEMMVAIAATLIMMFAVVKIFDILGDTMTGGRASIEMAGELRAAAQRLQQDLDGRTVPTLPWGRLAEGGGYFEYREGPDKDKNHFKGGNNQVVGVHGFKPPPEFLQPLGPMLGDSDDVLMFTSRSTGEPFVGRINGQARTSELAEIIWWAQVDKDGGLNIYRRVLLIRPDLSVSPMSGGVAKNDLSIGADGTANSLADLADRGNRFAHAGGFPLPIDTAKLMAKAGPALGDDVVLGHVLAFDVRVYDPYAPIPNASSFPPPRGAYVDLNYANNASVSLNMGFSGKPNAKSQLTVATWDTWPFHWEHDGVGSEWATDGLDNDNKNGVDDPGEFNHAPPYAVPLRGIEVRIRMIEQSTRQVRQVSVVSNFVPE